jgi:photosystem II stability/assembly factor-like uncharacterized protein
MSRHSVIDISAPFLGRQSLTGRSGAMRVGLLSVVCLLFGMLTACSNGDHPAASLVAQAPVVTSNPADLTVQAGQTATFSVVATGSAPLAYQWQRGTVSIAGATAASYTTPATVVGDSGATYAVVVSNAAGSAASAPAMLTVTALTTLNVTITQQPLNRSVASGAQASFAVAAICSDGSAATYQWQRSNDAGVTFGNVSGATGAVYTLVAALSDNAARFRAVAACGSVTLNSNAATLTVAATKAASVGPCYGIGPSGGWCWQNRTPVSVTLHAGTAANASTAWAIGDLGVVVKTTDGGSTWQRVRRFDDAGGFYKGMSAADANTVWAVGANGQIIKTVDGGATWTSQSSGTTDILNDVAANGVGSAWTVGVNGVLHTTDGGITWQKLSTLAGPLFRLSAPTATTVYVTGQPDLVSRTTDAGLTWSTVQLVGLNGTLATALSAPSATVAWVVGTSGVIERTTDGTTWSTVTGPTSSSAQPLSILALSALTAYVSYADGSIAQTINGGATWTSFLGNRFAAAETLFAADANTLWGVGVIGLILNSKDAGTTWIEQSRGPRLQLTSVSAIDATTAWAAGFGGVIARTTDGGTTWPLVHDDSAFFTPSAAGVIQVGAVSASTAWAAGGFASTLIKTTDGGATWPVQSGFGSAPVNVVTVVDANTLWIAGPSGFIAKTVNAGGTWTTQNPGTTRSVFNLYALDGLVAYVAFDDGSVRRTGDGGATWTLATGFDNQHTSIVLLDANTLVSVNLGGIIRRSTDGGTTFTAVASGTTQDLQSATRSGNTLWAAGFFVMLRSDDAGITWRSQPIPGFEVGAIEAISAVDANTAWAVSFNSAIIHTTDGGD